MLHFQIRENGSNEQTWGDWARIGVGIIKQYSINTDLKPLVKDGESPVTPELAQWNYMNTFTLVDGLHFSKEEKKVAITSLMLPAENNLTSSRAENAQMAGIRVENSKKKIQHPQQFQLKVLLLHQPLMLMINIMWQPSI